MARFQCGINRDIQCIVKLQHYESLKDMVHQDKKVERQLKRKHSYQKAYHYDSFSGKDKSKKEGSSPPKQQGSKSPSGKHVPNPSTSSTSRSSSIKCFKCLGRGHSVLHCLNQKTIVFSDNEIITSEFSSISPSDISSDNDNGCGTKRLDDELMMCKRLLGIQCKDKDEIQKNIFQTRCLVLGNVCYLIIDRGQLH